MPYFNLSLEEKALLSFQATTEAWNQDPVWGYMFEGRASSL